MEPLPKNCKNCEHLLTGKFCAHCGQAADTHKLNMHFIWHEIQHGLIHVDHGIFYTIKKLLTVPGETINEFIEGKRIRHFKPVTLVVVLATLYGLLYHYSIKGLYQVDPILPDQNILGAYAIVIGWTTDHAAYSSLILILTNTLASYLVFRKQRNNFAEHLVLNTFYRALSLTINLLLLPVFYLSGLPAENPIMYTLAIQIVDISLMYWCYTGFFVGLSKIKILILTLLTFLLMSTINTAFGYIIGLIVETLT